MISKRSQTTLAPSNIKRDFLSPSNNNNFTTDRSITAFDLKRHYAHRSIYTKSSTIHLKSKFNLRPQSVYHQLHPLVVSPQQQSNGIPTPVISPLSIQPDDRPRRTLWTLIRIGIVFFGIELLFSIETGLTVPLLLQLKVPESVYSFVWVVSPLLGVLFQPLLGILSDRSESRFGRRKPFIFILALAAFFGLMLMLNAVRIGSWFGDKPSNKIPLVAVIFTSLGVTFLDFSADSSDSLLRAFILDVCNIEDQDTALNIHAFLGGFGGGIGFVFAAIDWQKTFFRYIGSQTEILFIISTIIFVICLVLTLTSVKEEQFYLNDKNDEKKPLIDKSDSNREDLLTILPEDLEENGEAISMKIDPKSPIVFEIDEDDDKPITVKLLFHSLMNVPKELGFLMIGAWTGWLAYFSVTLFLTDYVAETVYHGDPYANANSTVFLDYDKGVKMGCWCLFCAGICAALYAILLERVLINRFSTRILLFCGYLFHVICVSCIYYANSIYIIIPLCSSCGVLYTTLSTIPFQMLAEFHQDDEYRSKSPKGTKRGIGIDCSLITSCFFLAQTVVAAITSLLVSALGHPTIVIMSALIALSGCFWIAIVMKFPEDKAKIQKK